MTCYQPKLTIVDAGPGDVDLITVRGARILRAAIVILYDARVNETLLLEYAPTAIKVYVGKRRNRKALAQEDINELIVEYAQTYGQVVRLKSGGSIHTQTNAEEIRYAQARGLQVEYIPGVQGLIEPVSPQIFKNSKPVLANVKLS